MAEGGKRPPGEDQPATGRDEAAAGDGGVPNPETGAGLGADEASSFEPEEDPAPADEGE